MYCYNDFSSLLLLDFMSWFLFVDSKLILCKVVESVLKNICCVTGHKDFPLPRNKMKELILNLIQYNSLFVNNNLLVR